MTSSRTTTSSWRLGVRGVVRPRTAALLSAIDIRVAETTTVLETSLPKAEGCASTVATLQSFGLEVVEVHREP